MGGAEWVLADAHVHYHACFDLPRFLDGAWGNFRAGAAGCRIDGDWVGCLFLADTVWENHFSHFASLGSVGDGRWRFERLKEPESMIARSGDGAAMVVVAGRQLLTREGIEVLALGWPQTAEEGQPVREVLRRVAEAGGIAVVPWGFGKWWGRRGACVRELLETSSCPFYLGDNRNRPWGSRMPRLLRDAEAQGIRVLPGTDPLPFRRHEKTAGRYGFVLRGRMDINRPFAWLRRCLENHGAPLPSYGPRENPVGFLIDQVRMQTRKRRSNQ